MFKIEIRIIDSLDQINQLFIRQTNNCFQTILRNPLSKEIVLGEYASIAEALISFFEDKDFDSVSMRANITLKRV